MPPKQIKLDKRDAYIMVWTTPEIKAQLKAIADERGWSLSLLVYEILQDWLEQQAPAEEDEDG